MAFRHDINSKGAPRYRNHTTFLFQVAYLINDAFSSLASRSVRLDNRANSWATRPRQPYRSDSLFIVLFGSLLIIISLEKRRYPIARKSKPAAVGFECSTTRVGIISRPRGSRARGSASMAARSGCVRVRSREISRSSPRNYAIQGIH